MSNIARTLLKGEDSKAFAGHEVRSISSFFFQDESLTKTVRSLRSGSRSRIRHWRWALDLFEFWLLEGVGLNSGAGREEKERYTQESRVRIVARLFFKDTLRSRITFLQY